MAKWLPEETTPGLRKAVEIYIEQTQALADEFIILIAEALDLRPTTFNKVLHRKYPMSNLRISAYPRVEPSMPTETEAQGVGPHKDGSFFTYLLQGTEYSSLEVQNR